MADKLFEVKEKKRIIHEIKNNWEVSSATEELIYEKFRELISQETTSEVAFNVFEDYVLTHKKVFNQALITKIKTSCNTIAKAFSGKNKSELITLTRLHLLFENL